MLAPCSRTMLPLASTIWLPLTWSPPTVGTKLGAGTGTTGGLTTGAGTALGAAVGAGTVVGDAAAVGDGPALGAGGGGGGVPPSSDCIRLKLDFFVTSSAATTPNCLRSPVGAGGQQWYTDSSRSV